MNGTVKKVFIYSEQAYPLFSQSDGKFGGAEVDLYFLAKELARRSDYKVDFLVGDYGQAKIQYIDGVRVIRLTHMNIGLYRKFLHKLTRRLFIIYELIRSDADIYLTEAHTEVLGYMGLICKLLKRKKLIYRTAHDWDCNGYHTSRRDIVGLMFSIGIRFTDKIISQNDRQREMWKENYGIDTQIIKNGWLIPGEKNIINKEYILWIARSTSWKRPEKFVELARSLPDQKFVMVIKGDNDLTKDILEMSRDIPNLKIVNDVPFHEVQSFYDRAKCFVNTSDDEGFPNSFLQSFLGGTPVLSYNVDPDNVITDYDLGYHCANDPNKAARFIDILSEEKISRYGENAIMYMKEHHDLIHKVSQYDQLISDLY